MSVSPQVTSPAARASADPGVHPSWTTVPIALSDSGVRQVPPRRPCLSNEREGSGAPPPRGGATAAAGTAFGYRRPPSGAGSANAWRRPSSECPSSAAATGPRGHKPPHQPGGRKPRCFSPGMDALGSFGMMGPFGAGDSDHRIMLVSGLVEISGERSDWLGGDVSGRHRQTRAKRRRSRSRSPLQ